MHQRISPSLCNQRLHLLQWMFFLRRTQAPHLQPNKGDSSAGGSGWEGRHGSWSRRAHPPRPSLSQTWKNGFLLIKGQSSFHPCLGTTSLFWNWFCTFKKNPQRARLWCVQESFIFLHQRNGSNLWNQWQIVRQSLHILQWKARKEWKIWFWSLGSLPGIHLSRTFLMVFIAIVFCNRFHKQWVFSIRPSHSWMNWQRLPWHTRWNTECQQFFLH